jgi:hypothetical protein
MNEDYLKSAWWIPFAVAFACLMILAGIAKAEEPINIERLVKAIYYAEGGDKTSHPYGILAHYKHTTPRQACINTIKHALRDFRGGDFIAFLASRYAPIGVANDPKGLNRNWVKNVRRLYGQ